MIRRRNGEEGERGRKTEGGLGSRWKSEDCVKDGTALGRSLNRLGIVHKES